MFTYCFVSNFEVSDFSLLKNILMQFLLLEIGSALVDVEN